MSLARTGALPNSYKFFTIAVNSYENRQPQGFILHESREGAAAFKSLSQMAYILNRMFDEIHYPMKSLDERHFQRKQLEDAEEERVAFTALRTQQDAVGELATFRLHVKFRYHATWQGNITHVETGTVYTFESFMELMNVFDRLLGEPRRKETPLGKRMCEVAVCNYQEKSIGGEVSHPAVQDRFFFKNEFELLERMEMMLGERPAGSDAGNVITPRQGSVYKGTIGPVTFLVRVLFRRNDTWQGTICWKEKGEQASFRSFLEMLMMMESAVQKAVLPKAPQAGREEETA